MGYRFSPGLTFMHQDRTWVIHEELEGNRFVIKDTGFNGIRKTVTEMELVSWHDSGTLVIEERGKHTIVHEKNGFSRSMIPDFSMLDEKERKEAERRYEAIKPLLMIANHQAISDYVKERAIQASVSERSLYRWLRYYRESQGDIRSLVDSRSLSGRRGLRLQKEVEEIMCEAIHKYYHTKETMTAKDVSDLIRDRINDTNKFRNEKLKVPDPSTVYRRIQMQDPEKATKAKYGGKAAKEQYGMKTKQEKPERPLDRVEIDHTQLDIIVLDNDNKEVLGRPYITVAIDCCTGYVLGMYIGFESPSYRSIMKTLQHAMSGKSYLKAKYPDIKNDWLAYGKPRMLVTDNGKDFLSKDLSDACLQLGIELFQCPIKQPWYKGAVERFFRTLNSLIHSLPGTTFSNTQERKKRDYNSEKKAVISFSALIGIIHTWIVDTYLEEFHEGVGGIPRQKWKHGIAVHDRPQISAHKFDLNIALMKVDSRTISAEGINFLRWHYLNAELKALRLELEKRGIERVKFKYDPDDLSKLFAFDEIQQRYIEVPNTDPRSQGVSLSMRSNVLHQKNQERKEVDRDGIAAAKAKIQQQVKEERKRARAAAKNKRKQEAMQEGVNSANEVAQTALAAQGVPSQAAEGKATVVLFKPKQWGGSVAN
jgi:putative transposase